MLLGVLLIGCMRSPEMISGGLLFVQLWVGHVKVQQSAAPGV